MFTIEQNLEEHEWKQMREFKKKQEQGKELTAEEIEEDFARQHKKRCKNVYPTGLGVTGEVFKSG